jgi:dihydroorotase
MLELCRRNFFTPELTVERMCHAPARLFHIKKRGFIREGYYADLVVVDPNAAYTVSKENIYYKCGWSPFEGQLFHAKVTHTFVNGHLAYDNGRFDDTRKGQRLQFERQKVS